jgi:hypothetical protein
MGDVCSIRRDRCSSWFRAWHRRLSEKEFQLGQKPGLMIVLLAPSGVMASNRSVFDELIHNWQDLKGVFSYLPGDCWNLLSVIFKGNSNPLHYSSITHLHSL